MKKIFILTIIIVFSNTSLFSQETFFDNISSSKAMEIIQQFKSDTNFIILDLRPEKMFEEGHIGNAIYFDVFSTEFEDWISKQPRNKIYLIYCTVGHRSGIALQKMKDLGFTKIYHMEKGLQEWKQLNFPLIISSNK